MLRKIRPLALAAGLVAVASPALATPLYGGNTSPRFFSVDDLSDADPMTSISTGGYQVQGLAWNFSTNTMYGGNDTRFFSVNPNTGAMTSINSSITYSINDLVFGPGNVLFGGNDAGRFFSIDPSTGAETLIALDLNWQTKGMSYDSVTDILYGVGKYTPDDSFRLFTIDPGTGAKSGIVNWGSNSSNDLRAIAIDPVTGVMYGATNPLIGTGNVYTINKSTGAKTLIQGSPSYGSSGLAFIPEPGTMLLLGMGLVGLGISGRKKA